ncbi:MAG TPA: CYTH domain-containing protein [Anaerolineales bacterium]|nr:CYTH domain-containing protein [Anaerolineales bacterium]
MSDDYRLILPTMPQPTEIEAKFTIRNKKLWQSLMTTPTLYGWRVGETMIHQVIDRYLDTETKRLAKAGYQMRERSKGQQKLLTIKSQASSSNKISIRNEIEFPLPGDYQWENWQNPAVQAQFSNILKEHLLCEQFSLHQTRHVRLLSHGENANIEMSLDLVKVVYQNKILDEFQVLELELLPTGTLHDLLILVDEFSHDAGLHAVTVGKLIRAKKAVKAYQQALTVVNQSA